MKKKIAVAALLAAALMAACSDKGAKDEAGDNKKETTPGESGQEKKDTPKEDAGKLTAQTPSSDLNDELFSYQMQIEDQVYSFPMSFSDFQEKGWSFEGDETEKLEGFQYMSGIIWKNGDLSCYTYLANQGEGQTVVTDSMVAGIELNRKNLESAGSYCIMPKNIQVGISAREEIMAAYGEPTRQTDGSLTYEEKNYSEVRFVLDSETGLLDSVTIQKLGE